MAGVFSFAEIRVFSKEEDDEKDEGIFVLFTVIEAQLAEITIVEKDQIAT